MNTATHQYLFKLLIAINYSCCMKTDNENIDYLILGKIIHLNKHSKTYHLSQIS